jgi:hypothetical protein
MLYEMKPLLRTGEADWPVREADLQPLREQLRRRSQATECHYGGRLQSWMSQPHLCSRSTD